MANKRIKDLTIVTAPAVADVVPIDGAGGTRGVAPKNILAPVIVTNGTIQAAIGTSTFYNGVLAAPINATLTLNGSTYISNGGTLSGDFPAFGNEPTDSVMTRAGTIMFTTVTDATLGASQALTAQAQFEASATGLASGGAVEFGAINNTNSATWDGYGSLHILKTPVGAAHPRGTAMWSLLRGGEVNTTAGDLVGIAGVGTTNEAGHDSNVTFNTTTDAVHWVAHGLTAGKRVQFSLSGGTLPSPLVIGTIYFVKTVLGVDDFTLAATLGGALIDLTGSPTATVVGHTMQNADRGMFIGNSTPYNSYITGLIIGGARDYGVRVGSGDGSAVNSIPLWPFSFYNAAGTALFSVSNTGAIVSPSINGLTITASAGTLTVDTTKTLIVSNTMQLLANDGAAITFVNGGTVVYRTSTDTLTNKTFNTASNTFTVNGVSLDAAWTAYTPTVTASSGTFTTVSASGAYKQVGKTVIVRIEVNITTNGSAAVKVLATLPVAAAGTVNQALSGFNSSTGAAIAAGIAPADTKVSIFTVTGTYPGANATILNVQGVYEVP